VQDTLGFELYGLGLDRKHKLFLQISEGGEAGLD